MNQWDDLEFDYILNIKLKLSEFNMLFKTYSA